MRTLIFIPTYNERENVEPLCQELLALNLGADILFIDDDSPDGTGQVLDALASAHPEVRVIHRAGKEGIGSAHSMGINHAYDAGYDRLLTMDCDFTHPPADIPRLFAAQAGHDVVIGSRYVAPGGLANWTFLRKAMTMLAHVLTTSLLGLPQDASGAFRVYNLKSIPKATFGLIRSTGYAFFFESLFILVCNGFTIKEIPIVPPLRAVGHSKLTFWESLRSARILFGLFAQRKTNPERFLLPSSRVSR